MKKYVVLSSIIISGLAFAAAEPSKSKREISCPRLARFFVSRPHVKQDELAIQQTELRQFSCTQLWLWGEEQDAFDRALQTAEKAKERLAALESCVQKSPRHALNSDVLKAKALLQGLSIERWQQCLKARSKVVQEFNDEQKKITEKTEDKEGARSCDKQEVQDDPNPRRINFSERWLPDYQ